MGGSGRGERGKTATDGGVHGGVGGGKTVGDRLQTVDGGTGTVGGRAEPPATTRTHADRDVVVHSPRSDLGGRRLRRGGSTARTPSLGRLRGAATHERGGVGEGIVAVADGRARWVDGWDWPMVCQRSAACR